MNILIVEDERVAARRLDRLTNEILGEKFVSVRCLGTLDRSKRALSGDDIDVVLLDLNLNGEDGFELLKHAAAGRFHTIVVSANTDRAIEAYEYGVLDFVPKPVDRARLVRAFERMEDPPRDGSGAANRLVVRNRGRLQVIPIEEISYLRGAGDYSEIHCTDGSVALHNKSLESLERILPESFFRIHKSYITDLQRIVHIKIYGGGKYECELSDGAVLPVSRTRYKDLRQRIGTTG